MISNEIGAEGRQQTYSDQGVLGIDLEDQDGAVVVTNLWPGSPAEQAGLRTGDEIVSIGDQDVEEQSDLKEALRDYRPGERVRLTLSRDGEERNVRSAPRLAAGIDGKTSQPGPRSLRGRRTRPTRRSSSYRGNENRNQDSRDNNRDEDR